MIPLNNVYAFLLILNNLIGNSINEVTNTYIEEAKIFFDKYSKKYKDCPNILYEICNEPNGTIVTWNDSIKPYAETIIPEKILLITIKTAKLIIIFQINAIFNTFLSINHKEYPQNE